MRRGEGFRHGLGLPGLDVACGSRSRCGALVGDPAGATNGVSVASGREWISPAKVSSPQKNNTQ